MFDNEIDEKKKKKKQNKKKKSISERNLME